MHGRPIYGDSFELAHIGFYGLSYDNRPGLSLKHDNFTFSFFQATPLLFLHNECINLRRQLKFLRVPVSLHPSQRMLAVSLIAALLC